MKTGYLISFILLLPILLSGQDKVRDNHVKFPKHYLSVNPLNCLFFQQIGVTYEFKPGPIGYGITTGYIYPNYEEYSNYFIAGVTNYASLGDYSGLFVIPQFNFYLNNPKRTDKANLFYFSLKFVYKYMYLDSTYMTAWYNEGDDYYLYRKMIDKVNIYGGFVDFGYKFYIKHFFFDLNLGIGLLGVDHNMIISMEGVALGEPKQLNSYNPPKTDALKTQSVTINFTLNIGGAF